MGKFCEHPVMVAIRMSRHTWASLTHLAAGSPAHPGTRLLSIVLALCLHQLLDAACLTVQQSFFDRFLGFYPARSQYIVFCGSLPWTAHAAANRVNRLSINSVSLFWDFSHWTFVRWLLSILLANWLLVLRINDTLFGICESLCCMFAQVWTLMVPEVSSFPQFSLKINKMRRMTSHMIIKLASNVIQISSNLNICNN